jgi:hypothetical protein
MASLQYALVILPEEDPITEWMVEPFKRHRLRLLMELGLAVRDLQVKRLDDVYQAVVGTNATIVLRPWPGMNARKTHQQRAPRAKPGGHHRALRRGPSGDAVLVCPVS